MPDTKPAPSDQPSTGRSAQPALEAVQVALDRRDNGGEAATAGHRRGSSTGEGHTTGHHRINRAAAGKDHLGRRTAQA